jgi:hypothetical protein
VPGPGSRSHAGLGCRPWVSCPRDVTLRIQVCEPEESATWGLGGQHPSVLPTLGPMRGRAGDDRDCRDRQRHDVRLRRVRQRRRVAYQRRRHALVLDRHPGIRRAQLRCRGAGRQADADLARRAAHLCLHRGHQVEPSPHRVPPWRRTLCSSGCSARRAAQAGDRRAQAVAGRSDGTFYRAGSARHWLRSALS